MNRIVSSLALLVVAQAIAQPIIQNGNNLPQPGYSVSRYYVASSLDAGPAGANQTWDFSSASMISLFGEPYTVLTPATSPYASTWPTANYVATYPDAGSDNYFYYNVLADRLEAVADNVTSPSSYDIYTADRRTKLKFPFAYGESVVDTYTDPFSNYTETVTYDGYGTLITSNTAFSQVVRIKTAVTNGNTFYDWWTLNPLLPVLQFRFGNLTQWAEAGGAIGINEVADASAVQVYPNPVTDRATISIALTSLNAGAQLTLTNTMGQVVRRIPLNSTSTVLERGELAGGIYLYRVSNGAQAVATGHIVLN